MQLVTLEILIYLNQLWNAKWRHLANDSSHDKWLDRLNVIVPLCMDKISKGDLALIKCLRQAKNSSSRSLLRKFPGRNWAKTSAHHLLNKTFLQLVYFTRKHVLFLSTVVNLGSKLKKRCCACKTPKMFCNLLLACNDYQHPHRVMRSNMAVLFTDIWLSRVAWYGHVLAM